MILAGPFDNVSLLKRVQKSILLSVILFIGSIIIALLRLERVSVEVASAVMMVIVVSQLYNIYSHRCQITLIKVADGIVTIQFSKWLGPKHMVAWPVLDIEVRIVPKYQRNTLALVIRNNRLKTSLVQIPLDGQWDEHLMRAVRDELKKAQQRPRIT